MSVSPKADRVLHSNHHHQHLPYHQQQEPSFLFFQFDGYLETQYEKRKTTQYEKRKTPRVILSPDEREQSWLHPSNAGLGGVKKLKEIEGYCSQHAEYWLEQSAMNHLNSRFRQAVALMSEFLASNWLTASTEESFSLHDCYLGADFLANLDRGFDIDTAGLTLAIHEHVIKVSKPWLRFQNCREIPTYFEQSHAQGKERNEWLWGTALVSYHLSS